MKKFFSVLKIALQVLKCLRCVHISECPYCVVSTVLHVDKKHYLLTVQEVEKNDNQ